VQEEVEEHIVALVQTRLELAQLVGSESYSHYRLKDCSLAQTPEAVSAYLQRLQASASSEAASEVKELEKFGLEYSSSFKRLTQWDRAAIECGYLSASLRNAGLPVSTVQVCFLAAFSISRLRCVSIK
jgi:Zn-dependent oligopeptidase